MLYATPVAWADRRIGDIGVVWGVGPLADAIEALEGYAGEGDHPPSHGIIIGDNANVLEAVWPRVELTLASIYQPVYAAGNVELYRLNISPPSVLTAYISTKSKYLNAWYDIGGLFGFLFVEIGRHFGRRMVNYFASKQMAWCSEVCAYMINQACGAVLDQTTTDPAGLRNWLKTGRTRP